MPTGGFNPKAHVQLRHIGHEQNPVLVIDDLWADPQALIETAVAAQWHPPRGTYYPGLNADLPEVYMSDALRILRPSFGRAFGLPEQMALLVHGFFALATWELADFGPWQRIPHYDQPHPYHFAMVHYLHPSQRGGTGFFRHLASGIESMSPARREPYLRDTTAWLAAHTDELLHFAGPRTPGYEMIDQVDFKLNRAVIYPSCLLHCALFDDAVFSSDPRLGRLTANSFFTPG